MKSAFLLILSATLACSASGAEQVDYVRDVLPIFETYCFGCHSADEANGGLVMESHDALMTGGENGSAITAGVPTSSRLFLMASGKMDPVMPPDGEQGLDEEELAIIAAWIEQGAIGPDGEVPIKRELRTPKIPTADNVTLPITAIAISTDGGRRAVARYGNITILDAQDEVIRSIDGDFGKVNAVSFNRDGDRVLIASGVTGAYGQATVFSIVDGRVVTELVGHRDVLYAAVYSPDESRIATAGYDREIVLWDTATGEAVQKYSGHNGAIFDLAFSPDGKVLISGCADETAKVWNVKSGQRLDTLSQPEGVVFAVDVTPDGKFVIAGSADNRLRVWRLRSTDRARINPIVATRFVDESPLVNFAWTDDGRHLIVMSRAGNLKIISVKDWNQVAFLESVGNAASDLSITDDGSAVLVSMLDGTIARREIPRIKDEHDAAPETIELTYLDLGELTTVDEADDSVDASAITDVPRGAIVKGTIASPGDADFVRWTANRGEVWAIDADATGMLDPVATIFDDSDEPVLRVRLQAVRDSYFTFRGKDSSQTNDFRMFNWEEMGLDDYLYASGEVTRLHMYPRGPDSGFNTYPNEGDRWTYFGTSHATHALGEPAYVVLPLAGNAEPVANGLPVFDVYYENDDDPTRRAGSNSRIIFTTPADGRYTVRITDTRGEGGPEYNYQLTLRAAEPSFNPMIDAVSKPLMRGGGREFTVRVDRIDGFDGAVTFDVDGLPESIVSNFPVTIQPGQRYAHGTVWIDESAIGWDGKVSPTVTASAEILGRRVERTVGTLGALTVAERSDVIVSIQPSDRETGFNQNWTLTIPRGQTVSARVILDRKTDFTREVKFGKENAGRNAAHGVYVDNIGLNGLLALEGMTEREFFITADPVAEVGERTFFLTAEIDGGVTSHPITIKVTP